MVIVSISKSAFRSHSAQAFCPSAPWSPEINYFLWKFNNLSLDTEVYPKLSFCPGTLSARPLSASNRVPLQLWTKSETTPVLYQKPRTKTLLTQH